MAAVNAQRFIARLAAATTAQKPRPKKASRTEAAKKELQLQINLISGFTSTNVPIHKQPDWAQKLHNSATVIQKQWREHHTRKQWTEMMGILDNGENAFMQQSEWGGWEIKTDVFSLLDREKRLQLLREADEARLELLDVGSEFSSDEDYSDGSDCSGSFYGSDSEDEDYGDAGPGAALLMLRRASPSADDDTAASSKNLPAVEVAAFDLGAALTRLSEDIGNVGEDEARRRRRRKKKKKHRRRKAADEEKSKAAEGAPDSLNPTQPEIDLVISLNAKPGDDDQAPVKSPRKRRPPDNVRRTSVDAIKPTPKKFTSASAAKGNARVKQTTSSGEEHTPAVRTKARRQRRASTGTAAPPVSSILPSSAAERRAAISTALDVRQSLRAKQRKEAEEATALIQTVQQSVSELDTELSAAEKSPSLSMTVSMLKKIMSLVGKARKQVLELQTAISQDQAQDHVAARVFQTDMDTDHPLKVRLQGLTESLNELEGYSQLTFVTKPDAQPVSLGPALHRIRAGLSGVKHGLQAAGQNITRALELQARDTEDGREKLPPVKPNNFSIFNKPAVPASEKPRQLPGPDAEESIRKGTSKLPPILESSAHKNPRRRASCTDAFPSSPRVEASTKLAPMSDFRREASKSTGSLVQSLLMAKVASGRPPPDEQPPPATKNAKPRGRRNSGIGVLKAKPPALPSGRRAASMSGLSAADMQRAFLDCYETPSRATSFTSMTISGAGQRHPAGNPLTIASGSQAPTFLRGIGIG